MNASAPADCPVCPVCMADDWSPGVTAQAVQDEQGGLVVATDVPCQRCGSCSYDIVDADLATLVRKVLLSRLRPGEVRVASWTGIDPEASGAPDSESPGEDLGESRAGMTDSRARVLARLPALIEDWETYRAACTPVAQADALLTFANAMTHLIWDYHGDL